MLERVGDQDPARLLYAALESLDGLSTPVTPGAAREQIVSLYTWDFDAPDYQRAVARLLCFGILLIDLEGKLQLIGQISQLDDPDYYRQGD